LQADERFRDTPTCDFAVERESGRIELLECKRFHSGTNKDGNGVASAVAKLSDRIPDAVKQLRSSAAVIGAERCDQHLLIDIAAYGGSTRITPVGELEIEETGLAADEVQAIAAAIMPLIADLHKVTLCWHSHLKINGRYRAIVQRAESPLVRRDHMLNYAGWTVEAYPQRNLEYREIRVSSIARSLSWIVASYNNLSSPEAFFTVGPEVRLG
jgi:hypothetical protein